VLGGGAVSLLSMPSPVSAPLFAGSSQSRRREEALDPFHALASLP
jgi:hypothetical protein